MRTVVPLAWEPEPTKKACKAETLRYIPLISKETVTEMLSRITPLIRRDGILYEFVPTEPWDPFTRCFTWENDTSATQAVDSNALKLLDAIVTYHHCQYHACVKPRVFEVLAQIPEHLRKTVTAFEVLVENGVLDCVDYPGLYGHKTVTLLYGRKTTE